MQRVDLSAWPFKLWVGEDENELHLTQTVIVATGARANYLDMPSEKTAEEPRRQRVPPCATVRCSATRT